jgi:hypothetical protein
MTIHGLWDDMVIGRGITRPGNFGTGFSPNLVQAVGGPRHSEFVDFALRLQSKIPQIIGWEIEDRVWKREEGSS